jgi:hypothetical protein
MELQPYACSSCRTEFSFAVRNPHYYVGPLPIKGKLQNADVLAVPVRPAWCASCSALAPAEAIASLRDMENAFGALRMGKALEYPMDTANLPAAEATRQMSQYLLWRMHRRRPARALCCGGKDFQFLDVALPLFKHADCDFGVLAPVSYHIGAHIPRVSDSADIRLYDIEGTLIARLTRYHGSDDSWEHEQQAYPPACDD